MRLPQCALDFGMALVADHDDLAAGGAHASHFNMNLGHQRAGGVKHLQPARLGFRPHRLGHAVGREHDDGARGRVVQFIDEDRALGAQVFHHIAVVDDLMAHVDRGAMQFDRALDDVDGAVHAGTEAARLGQHDFGVGGGNGLAHQRTPSSATSSCKRTPASGWLKSNSADSSLISFSTPE
ncbi:hypothetical protein D3C71_1198000 [compost metagenome]